MIEPSELQYLAVLPPPPRPHLAALLFIPIFLLYGLLACAWGYSAWQDWSFISPGLRGFSILAGVTGPLMVVSSLWLLGSMGRRPLTLQVGGLAATGFGVLQAVGSLTEIVPCSGPA